MNLKEIEKIVASIQSHLFRNSNSYSIGMLKSHFKGAGLQFKEHQVYAPGDDIRFIDWKLSAKSQNIYVKTFEEERNIEITPFLDLSQTMLMGYMNKSKLEAAIEIICLLYLLAEKSKDKIKVIVYEDSPIVLPALSGHEGIVFFISILNKRNIFLNGKINLTRKFKESSGPKKMNLLKSLVARHKEVVFLSDHNNLKEESQVLNKLIYRRNMHCFKLTSPVDDLDKMPFSLFVKNFGKKISSNSREGDVLLGRWKKLDVSSRYMEDFVREML